MSLNLSNNGLESIPDSLSESAHLRFLNLSNNRICDLPRSVAELAELHTLDLTSNPLNPELAAAHEQGVESIKRYLRARSEEQISLYEAKLILVGEGEVGKSSLLAALRGDDWIERETTHGIQVKKIELTHPENDTVLQLNAWDFGGQAVYRPTHQLFFSAPAIYLVIWKPREGPQQIEHWINLIRQRAGQDAKVIVVATHGGPQNRQPDLDQQALRQRFGSEVIQDFLAVDSKPDEHGERLGIEELKQVIFNVAMKMPQVGRGVPASWLDVRTAVAVMSDDCPYIRYSQYRDMVAEQGVTDQLAAIYASILHELGHVIHFGRDESLRDIMVLQPDWLVRAISFALDDQSILKAHGLVRHEHMSNLWSNHRGGGEGYAPDLHPLFFRLMEKF